MASNSKARCYRILELLTSASLDNDWVSISEPHKEWNEYRKLHCEEDVVLSFYLKCTVLFRVDNMSKCR